MKKIFIICTMVLLYLYANAQNKITGKITGQDNSPLIGATVFIPDMNKGTVSDGDGSFQLLNLPNGIFKLQFSYIGYANYIETVDLNGKDIQLTIVLRQTAVQGEEVVISGGYNATQHENAVKIEVLKLDRLEMKSTPNFMEIMTEIPGVDMISKGSGVSKPVIRGLSMNDVLVLNNGVRFENYQYSDHHPLGIDEFGVEDVEIIKGPASLLYGSDAIGGVLNFIKEKPAPIGSVVGDYNMQLFSNSRGMVNNLGVKGASKKFFGGLRAGQKTNSDYLQGGGTYVPNSRFNEISIKTNAGYTDELGTFKLFYDYNNQKLGLVEDEAVEEISKRGRKNEIFYQEFNNHLFSSQNKLYLGRYKLDVNAALQNTELVHVSEADVFEIQMKLATLTYEAKLHLPSAKNSGYIIGFQGFNQTNTNLNDREEILLPDATTNNYSGYGLMQRTFFSKLKLQTGIRYDTKSIETAAIGKDPDSMEYRAAFNKSFSSVSGSIGATYNATDELLFRANFASAYRTPNLAELTSNGQHELRYEIGDHNLDPENAYETDLSLHYHTDNVTFDLAGFYNRINNYIFIAPTGDTISSGIFVYKYRQANSTLFGGEADLHIHPGKLQWLHFKTSFSSVVGKQENGDYLPFIPANKLRFELRGEKEKLMFFNKAYISANMRTAFDQNNAAPDEETTKGYTLVDLSIGGNLKIQNQVISLSIDANNLFDIKYIDHLSTLKETEYFNPGSNYSLSLRIPFGIATGE